VAQRLALRRGKIGQPLGELASQIPGLPGEAPETLQESLGGVHRRRLGELLQKAQSSVRLGEQPRPTLFAGLQPGGVEGLALRVGELVAHQGPGQLLTGLRVGARQRHQDLHRRLGPDPSLADLLLNRGAELAHQPQAA
jgi:hypothetical protein